MIGYNKSYMEIGEWSTKNLPLLVKEENVLCDSINDNSVVLGQGRMKIRK
jgi:hypothetical protein